MLFFIWGLILLLNSATIGFAERVELFWDIGTLNISRDGYNTWVSICVNNAVPIPPVHVTQGDVLVLNVRNSLDEPTSVHAHGIYHNYTDYYDGAEMVTECGIPPGENFTYIIDTTTQAGDLWIHGHVHSQLTDGFCTPFIIHEKVKPTTYDKDEVLYFEDWNERSFKDTVAIDAKIKLADTPPLYRTMLINGVNANTSKPLYFEPRKRYRLHIMSLSTSCWVKFRMPGHTMHVVGKDGVESEPMEVDGLDLGPGQRVSIIVTAHNTAEFNYMYNVTLYANFITPLPGLMPRYYSGLIEYQKNAPLKTIPVVDDSQLVWNDVINMQARDRMPLLPFTPEHGIPFYSFGDYAYNRTLVPSLFTALTMGELASNSSVYGPQAQARILQYGESIELLVYNYNSKDHSLHLHRGEYQVVEVGPYGDAVANNRTAVEFQTAGPSPMRCDVLTIRAYSYIKLRFRVNRGMVALFHCHMMHGGYFGLAATFIAAPELLQKHVKVPEEAIRYAERVELFWDIGTLNISRDGYSTWKSICVNNAVPIPPVHVTQGDVLVLNVRNSLDVPTAVHAHGIYHNYTDYYDGAEMVTECGIPPGENFTYIIDTTDQVGNFWLHSHTQSQLTDGFRTPFIIHEKVKPTTYDEEKLLYFEDWDLRAFDDQMDIYSTLNIKEIPIAYRMLLVNGINGNATQPVAFVPGKQYRIRVVSLLTLFWIKFRMPGHTMHIIDQDGVACDPVEVDGLDMGPGQRFSVLVTAYDTAEFNYKYNVTLYANFIDPLPGIQPRYYSGLIEYQKNAPLKHIPEVNDDQLAWSNTLDLQARDGMPLLPVDRQIVLSIKQFTPKLDIPYYTFGDYAYNHSLVPTLFTALSMGDLAFNSSVYGPQAQAHVLHYGESIEVLVYSDNVNDHSLHMHMGEYQVVEVGPYGDAVAHNRPAVAFQRSGPSPMRSDVVTIRSFSYIKLRFRVNHGAIIFFHCHMIHNYKGLAVTFIAAPDLLQKHMKVPDEVTRMCKIQNIKTSGNAAGNQGFDLTGLPPPLLVNRG
ncbi:ferroxidase fet3 [Coemansia sp. RSA 1853]|nr:ferroxidase fet3 [Coemansia sp. RSA 1853]